MGTEIETIHLIPNGDGGKVELSTSSSVRVLIDDTVGGGYRSQSTPLQVSKLSSEQWGAKLNAYGVYLFWNGRDGFQMKLDPAFSNEIQGVCGNANGDSSDDMTLREGPSTENINTLIHSWTSFVAGKGVRKCC